MPIYEFICQSCGNEFEQIRSFSDSSTPECAACGSSQVVRRMGRPAIHFKGSGWYITDSKKSSEKNGKEGSKSAGTAESATEKSTEKATEGSADKVSEGSAASSGETKTESKTETKSTSSTENKSAPTSVAGA